MIVVSYCVCSRWLLKWFENSVNLAGCYQHPAKLLKIDWWFIFGVTLQVVALVVEFGFQIFQ